MLEGDITCQSVLCFLFCS